MARTAEVLIKQLKDEMSSGRLQPGDQLEESALADRFGVSRTPIREAVRSLVDGGFLETRPRKGAFVRTLSAKELHDLFEVAAELEGMACRLATTALTDDAAEAIEDGLVQSHLAAEAEDPDAYAAANIVFHRAIHAACDNLRLVKQLNDLQFHHNVYRAMPYRVRGRVGRSHQEHVEIKEAIFAGDGAKASDLMRSHIMMQGGRLPMIIAAIDQR